MAARLLTSTIAACLASLSLACASPCERVKQTRDEFLDAIEGSAAARPAPNSPAHLSLSLPNEVVDTLISAELERLPTASIPLPSVSGVSLGSMRVGIEQVRVRPAPSGQVGFKIVVGLREGKKTVLTLDLDARVRPKIDPGQGSITVALAGKDIVALEPSLGSKSKQQLGDLIWRQLPDAARMLIDKDAVGELASGIADQLLDRAADTVRRELLDDLGELARFEIDLPPELPIARVGLSAKEKYLDIDLITPLRVEQGLAPGHDRIQGIHPNLIQVRIAGDAAAALANRAIREGDLPERWTLEGEPDPKGDVIAGVGWAQGENKSLELHLWKLEDDCAYVVLRAEPSLRVQGTQLELGASEPKLDEVKGSFKIRAGLFFKRAAIRGLELVERTAATTEVELAGTKMQAQIHSAAVAGDELVLGLRIAPARSSKR